MSFNATSRKVSLHSSQQNTEKSKHQSCPNAAVFEEIPSQGELSGIGRIVSHKSNRFCVFPLEAACLQSCQSVFPVLLVRPLVAQMALITHLTLGAPFGLERPRARLAITGAVKGSTCGPSWLPSLAHVCGGIRQLLIVTGGSGLHRGTGFGTVKSSTCGLHRGRGAGSWRNLWFGLHRGTRS